MHLRFRAVIKCRSAYEAELPVEGMGSGHLRQGGDQHLTHALRPGTIQAGLDECAPDAAPRSQLTVVLGAARASRAWFRLLRRRSQRIERLCSLLCTLLAPLAEAGAGSRCLPHSLAGEKHACSLIRLGQRRATLAQHGGRAITDAPSSLLYWELLAHRAHGSAYFVVARRG